MHGFKKLELMMAGKKRKRRISNVTMSGFRGEKDAMTVSKNLIYLIK